MLELVSTYSHHSCNCILFHKLKKIYILSEPYMECNSKSDSINKSNAKNAIKFEKFVYIILENITKTVI